MANKKINSAQAMIEKLLKPIPQPVIKAEILGDEFPVKRLSCGRLSKYNQVVTSAQSGDESVDVNKAAALLILDSIVDADENPISGNISVDDFMNVHSALAIQSAVSEILKINFMADTAEISAKND